MESYKKIYDAWQRDENAFWMDAANDLTWMKAPSKARHSEDTEDQSIWFRDGVANTCYNAVDRHVLAGRGAHTAIIYDSPITGAKRKITYLELKEKTAKLGGALRKKGIGRGDRVIIYMPMVPEALVAMLACARIGAIHSVVFGGFAANELATRIDDATPKAIIAGSCGIEPSGVIKYKPLLDAAIDLSQHKPDFCVIFQRDEFKADLIEPRDLEWEAFQRDAEEAEAEPVSAADPVYILYTSGTTGAPKGVVRPSGGHMVALHWTMSNIYDVKPDDVFWAASDVGWVVGHSYICYAPLLYGATTVVFEGKPVGTPDAGAFWRVIEEHKVKVLFTAPTAFRAIKRVDPEAEHVAAYDLSSLKSLFLAGERADPDTILWAERHLKVPVIDHWWQTETGYAIAANPLGIEALPIKHGSPSVPMPGFDVRVLDADGQEKEANALGSIAIKLPLPPGCLPTLWNAHERYQKSYLSRFEGYYETGDAGYIDQDGYLYIMSRTDDVINVAGHRLSTGQMEEILAAMPDVAECAVIGVHDALKGQIPVGLLCVNAGCARSEEEIIAEAIQKIRHEIGAVAAFKNAFVVNRLPKTRSGKILRGTLSAIADGRDWKMPATIDDPQILEELTIVLKTLI